MYKYINNLTMILFSLTNTSKSLFHEASEPFVAHLTVMHAEPTASGLLEVVC